MYDIPTPPAAIEYIIPAAESGYYKPKQKLLPTPLVIIIDEARYEVEKKLAHVDISGAYGKSKKIHDYEGETIFLAYKDAAISRKKCPHVNVPLSDIARDIHFLDNSVTLSIANIPKAVAEKIHEHLCLSVNADIVKAISAYVYPPSKTKPRRYND